MPGIPLPSTTPTVPAHWRFPAVPASVAHARRLVAGSLPRDCSTQLSYELRLLTSELVTNAIRYGARADEDELIELIHWTGDGHHWLAVSDPGPDSPALNPSAPADPYAATGRGLLLVDALADVWAVVPRPVRGKSVVAGIHLNRF
jgi:anti-sigma regulatory factor (Ser/Thr protein kinase)